MTTRQNFSAEAEEGINRQINLELTASYAYQAAARYFEREDVALYGFGRYFQKASDEEREHAEKLQRYQLIRGGTLQYWDVPAPTAELSAYPAPGLQAMQMALDLERRVNQSLLDLHRTADEAGDPQMTDWLEGTFLNEQVEAIKELSDHVANLTRVGPGLGEYMFDRQTLGGGEPLKLPE